MHWTAIARVSSDGYFFSSASPLHSPLDLQTGLYLCHHTELAGPSTQGGPEEQGRVCGRMLQAAPLAPNLPVVAPKSRTTNHSCQRVSVKAWQLSLFFWGLIISLLPNKGAQFLCPLLRQGTHTSYLTAALTFTGLLSVLDPPSLAQIHLLFQWTNF